MVFSETTLCSKGRTNRCPPSCASVFYKFHTMSALARTRPRGTARVRGAQCVRSREAHGHSHTLIGGYIDAHRNRHTSDSVRKSVYSKRLMHLLDESQMDSESEHLDVCMRPIVQSGTIYAELNVFSMRTDKIDRFNKITFRSKQQRIISIPSMCIFAGNNARTQPYTPRRP